MKITLDVVGKFADLKVGDRVWYCFDMDEGPLEVPVSVIYYVQKEDGLHVSMLEVEYPTEVNVFNTETLEPEEVGASLPEYVQHLVEEAEKSIQYRKNDIAEYEKAIETYKGWLK